MMGCEQSLEKWQPSSPELLKLRSLTRQIEWLQNHKTSFLNQLESVNHAALVDKMVTKSLKTMIQQLEGQIICLEKQVKENIKKDEVLSRKFKHISTIKGVGLMSFAVVVSESNGFSLFRNQRQLVCYSGYDVIENQSGQRTHQCTNMPKRRMHVFCQVKWASFTKPFHGQELYRRSRQIETKSD
jgi:transposase